MLFRLITLAFCANPYYFGIADDLVSFPDAPPLDFDDRMFPGLSPKNCEGIG